MNAVNECNIWLLHAIYFSVHNELVYTCLQFTLFCNMTVPYHDIHYDDYYTAL